MPQNNTIQRVLDFWFGPNRAEALEFQEHWFKSSPEFDAAVTDGFAKDYERTSAGSLDGLADTPEGSLALVILLDQFPRNLSRGTATRPWAATARTWKPSSSNNPIRRSRFPYRHCPAPSGQSGGREDWMPRTKSVLGPVLCRGALGRGTVSMLCPGVLLDADRAPSEGCLRFPSRRPLVLFKSLLLQQRYRLSDPGLEEALEDRLSFRRFVGLALDASVPDHSTLSRFRQALSRHETVVAIEA